MTGSHSRAQLLLKIIEMAYAAADDGEVVRSVFHRVAGIHVVSEPRLHAS